MADIPGGRTTSANLQAGVDRSGGFERAVDSDWYAVSMRQGATYAVHAAHEAGRGGVPGSLSIHDAAGGSLGAIDLTSAYGSRIEGFEFIAPASGRYFVEVEREGGPAGVASSYTVGFDEDASIRPPAEPTMAVGQAANGAVDFDDDVDIWRVALQEGRSYRFTTDALFEVTSEQGKYLAIPDPDGEITDLDLRAPYTGDFLITVADDSVGPYRLTVEPSKAGPGNDPWRATTGADRIDGYQTQDAIPGRSGDDALRGRLGDDTLMGQDGNDRLGGDSGRDLLDGGAGRDQLTGGSGRDTFFFGDLADSRPGAGNRDTITDLASGDRIDLSGIDAAAGRAGDQPFRLVGDDAFTAGDLRLARVDGATVVQGNADADQAVEFELALTGSRQPSEGDFVL